MTIRSLHNETELLAKVAAGDERAFTELFDGYYHRLGEFVYQLTESRSTAQEIVQDTFVKIWLKRENLTEIKDFKNYIFILCRNHAYNALKKHAAQRSLLEKLLIEQTIEENDTLSLSENYRELINAAVEKLPAQAQKVYLMSRDEGLKHEEIASTLGISSETVKKHIQYARKFIMTDVQTKINGAVLTVLLTPLLLA